ncbi:hypothetical protein FRC08_010750 [Ceratobasidium sp. 394]|nr:hypothetical protein FRC08_010750 [Ceratobasidium sp. 394]
MTPNLHPEPLLPLEILLGILEVHFTADSWESVLAKPYQFLLINRTIHNRLLGIFYRTVVLKSPTQLTLFLETIRSSPHLGKLLSNMWVCTSAEVEVSGDERAGSPSLESLSIYMPNLQRLAIPKLGDNMGAIAPKEQSLLPHLHTLYVHCLPGRRFFVSGVSEHLKDLQRLCITIPPLKDEGPGYERIRGFWVRSLVAEIDNQATRIKEFIVNVPACPTNKLCVVRSSQKRNITSVVRMCSSLEDNEEMIYHSWLKD